MISRYTWCNQEVGDSCIHLSTENDEEYEVQKVREEMMVEKFNSLTLSLSLLSLSHLPATVCRGGESL